MTHPNDMTHWPEIGCQRGHDHHATKTVTVNLSHQHKYRDWPQIPAHLTQMCDMEIWDYAPYMTDGPYCPARDVVSEVIETHGCWEPAETIVMLDCFRVAPGNFFIDMGAQIGWYSKLASNLGMDVIAYEADPDVAALLKRNVPDALVVNDRIGPGTEQFKAYGPQPMRSTVKMDLEGAEPDGVRILGPLLDAGLLDYLLIEISPVFHDDYTEMWYILDEYDMRPFRLPGKQHPPARLRGFQDLTPIDAPAAVEILTGHQENVLFVREGLFG
jgi:hypothetical protein